MKTKILLGFTRSGALVYLADEARVRETSIRVLGNTVYVADDTRYFLIPDEPHLPQMIGHVVAPGDIAYGPQATEHMKYLANAYARGGLL